MTAMVSFFRTLRALARGNSFRVTTFSFVPPKSIIAMTASPSPGPSRLLRSGESLWDMDQPPNKVNAKHKGVLP